MYTSINYRTKKALKEDVASGKFVAVFQLGPFGGAIPGDGPVHIEGPHYPEPHKWYARAILKNGQIIKVS